MPPADLGDGAWAGELFVPEVQQALTNLPAAPTMLRTHPHNHLFQTFRGAKGAVLWPTRLVNQCCRSAITISIDPFICRRSAHPKPSAERTDISIGLKSKQHKLQTQGHG